MITEDYDVVVDTLTKHRDLLQQMNNDNARAEMFGIMDQIRFNQIDQINECLSVWKKHKQKQTTEDFYATSSVAKN